MPSLTLSHAFSLALIAGGVVSVSGAPLSRRFTAPVPREEQTKGAREYMQEALNSYLSTQNIPSKSFYPLESWTTVDYTNPNAAESNNLAFLSCDKVPNPSGNGSLFFFESYSSFVQDLGKAVEINQTDSSEYDNARDLQAKACGPDLVDAVGDALKVYISLGAGKPPANASDPALLMWAQTQYAPYMDAQLKCQVSTTNYNAESSKLFGNNEGIFSAAEKNLAPLLKNSTVDYPGLTMRIGGSTTNGSSGAGNATNGVIVPYYSIPVLNGTLSAWAQNAGLTPFSYSSSSTSSNSTTSSSSNSTKFVWNNKKKHASGNHTTESHASQSNDTFAAAKIEISAQSMGSMVVFAGPWYDLDRAASALINPTDDISKKGVPVLQKYYGSASKPGPAAIRNSKALIAYRPKISIQFHDNSSFKSFKDSQSEVGLSLPFVGLSAKSDKSSNATQFHDQNNTVVWEDKSQVAYILGYVQENFWDGAKNSTSS